MGNLTDPALLVRFARTFRPLPVTRIAAPPTGLLVKSLTCTLTLDQRRASGEASSVIRIFDATPIFCAGEKSPSFRSASPAATRHQSVPPFRYCICVIGG